jgi:hypothetical protein
MNSFTFSSGSVEFIHSFIHLYHSRPLTVVTKVQTQVQNSNQCCSFFPFLKNKKMVTYPPTSVVWLFEFLRNHRAQVFFFHCFRFREPSVLVL